MLMLQVPSHIQPWYPDTYIRNGYDVVMEQKSLDLNSDGTFLLRQKYQVTLNSDSPAKVSLDGAQLHLELIFQELTLVITSLSNYGTDIIMYNLIDSVVDLDSHSHITHVNKNRKFDGLRFNDVILTIHPSVAISIISNSTL